MVDIALRRWLGIVNDSVELVLSVGAAAAAAEAAMLDILILGEVAASVARKL